MGKSSKQYGVDFTVIRANVSLETPYLIRQAAKQAGFGTSAEWMRDRLARLLAAELEGETYEEIMGGQPPTWRDSPGAAKLHVAGKSSE